jgi:acyl-CoA synthetase (AMP-forming)/AMP-acid ligase II
VEEVLLRHGAVTEVWLIGRADPEWRESRVACVVVDDPSVSAQGLDGFCRQNLTGFNPTQGLSFPSVSAEEQQQQGP